MHLPIRQKPNLSTISWTSGQCFIVAPGVTVKSLFLCHICEQTWSLSRGCLALLTQTFYHQEETFKGPTLAYFAPSSVLNHWHLRPISLNFLRQLLILYRNKRGCFSSSVSSTLLWYLRWRLEPTLAGLHSKVRLLALPINIILDWNWLAWETPPYYCTAVITTL